MRKLFTAGVAIMAAMAAAPSCASDLHLEPALAVSEEYNDNIFGTADGRRTDYVTRVQPGMKLQYLTPILNLNAAYIFDYRNYARQTHQDEEIHNADLSGSLRFLDNFLVLDFGDALHRVTVNVARDVATESLLVQQTSQNIAFASPYLLWRPTARMTVKSGYRYTDTRYFEGAGMDKREQSAFASVEHLVSEKLMLSGGYAYTHSNAESSGYDRHNASGGFRYSFGPNSSIFGSIGNSWSRFPGGCTTSDLFWDAGVSQDFGHAVALVETKAQNVNDPLTVSTRQVSYLGRLDRAFKRGSLGVSALYIEYFVTETGKLEHRRGTLSASGRYQITPKLSVAGSLYGERFSRNSSDEYPYRFTANSSLSYSFFADQVRLTLAYTFVVDRLDLDSSHGEKLSNRVMIEARKGF